jgi:hypothetical protein
MRPKELATGRKDMYLHRLKWADGYWFSGVFVEWGFRGGLGIFVVSTLRQILTTEGTEITGYFQCLRETLSPLWFQFLTFADRALISDYDLDDSSPWPSGRGATSCQWPSVSLTNINFSTRTSRRPENCAQRSCAIL